MSSVVTLQLKANFAFFPNCIENLPSFVRQTDIQPQLYTMEKTSPVTIETQRMPLIPRFFLKNMFGEKSKEVPKKIIKRTKRYPIAKFAQGSDKRLDEFFSLDIGNEAVPWEVAMSMLEDNAIAYVMLSSLRYKVDQTNVFLSTALMTPAAQQLVFSTEGYTVSDDDAVSQGKIILNYDNQSIEAAVFVNPNSDEMKSQLVFIVKELYISVGSNFSLADMKNLIEKHLILN